MQPIQIYQVEGVQVDVSKQKKKTVQMISLEKPKLIFWKRKQLV